MSAAARGYRNLRRSGRRELIFRQIAHLCLHGAAAQINRSCGALEATLATYLSAAREGKIDEEALDELIEALSELDGCAQAGKLVIAGENELISIRRSLTDYTATIAQCRPAQLLKIPQTSGASEFSLIRDQLLQQKELLALQPGVRQTGSD